MEETTQTLAGNQNVNASSQMVHASGIRVDLRDGRGWKTRLDQSARALGEITGVSVSGLLVKHLRITTLSKEHEFMRLSHQVVPEIQSLLKEVREERKKIAERVLSGESAPKVIFCKFCGTRNEVDSSFCANCRAPLD